MVGGVGHVLGRGAGVEVVYEAPQQRHHGLSLPRVRCAPDLQRSEEREQRVCHSRVAVAERHAVKLDPVVNLDLFSNVMIVS